MGAWWRLDGAGAVWEDGRVSEREPARPAIPPEPNASAEPHDVLAAEEFAIPAPEAAWRDRPVELPPDPTGIEEPHDVLAAEMFAMPAPPPRPVFAQQEGAGQAGRARRDPLSWALAAGAAALGAAVVVAARRRRRRRG